MKTKFSIITLIIAATLSLTACIPLSDDITPPPGSEISAQPQVSAPTEAIYYPLFAPDPQAGALIYAEKCLECHGEYGLGDGSKAGELPNPVAPIGDPTLSRVASPASWYDMVTNGNIERYMPPFLSLSDRQRWDVVSYAMTLSAPVESVEVGAALYPENCAACHGTSGAGDGERAGEFGAMLDFTNQQVMAELSGAALFAGLDHTALGLPEGQFPSLTEEEAWGLVAYIRSLTFTSAGTLRAEEIPDAANTITDTVAVESETEPAAAEPINGLIDGQIVNLTTGELPAEPMEVTLYAYDNFQESFNITVSSDPTGAFVFDEIELVPQRAFILTTDHQNVTYYSNIIVVESEASRLNALINVYDSTSDTSQLIIDRLHLFFEYIPPETLRVAELIIISNPEDIVIAPENDMNAALQVRLPEGATNLQFQEDPTNYVPTIDGFGDMRPIYPGIGEHQVLFTFDMPYDRKLDLVQPLDLPVTEVVVLVPDNGLTFRADGFTPEGNRDIEGVPYNIFGGTDVGNGFDLEYTISGRPNTSGSPTFRLGSSSEMLVGIVGLAIAMIVAGVWLYRRPVEEEWDEEEDDEGYDEEDEDEEVVDADMPDMDVDALMDAIITLDDQYQDGEMAEAAYLQRRNALKEQLSKALGSES